MNTTDKINSILKLYKMFIIGFKDYHRLTDWPFHIVLAGLYKEIV